MEQGGGGMHESLSPLSADQSLFFDIKFLAREQAIYQRAGREFAKGFELAHKLTSLEKIRTQVGIESSVLELEYPQLTLLPQLPPLFRYLRAEELGGSIERGADTLLVGSGTTLNESLAVALKPPTQKQAETNFSNIFERMNTLHSRRREISQGKMPTSNPELIDHSITAIEPDVRQTEGFDRANEMFGTQTQLINTTLQEALLQLEGKKFNNIILNRLDPRIFESDPELLRTLMDFIQDSGSFVVTIGTGNSDEERQQRIDFIAHLPSVFAEKGISVKSRFPQEIKGSSKTLFGPDLIGGIVGRKIAV